jgi:hypothetical protein
MWCDAISNLALSRAAVCAVEKDTRSPQVRTPAPSPAFLAPSGQPILPL